MDREPGDAKYIIIKCLIFCVIAYFSQKMPDFAVFFCYMTMWLVFKV